MLDEVESGALVKGHLEMLLLLLPDHGARFLGYSVGLAKLALAMIGQQRRVKARKCSIQWPFNLCNICYKQSLVGKHLRL